MWALANVLWSIGKMKINLADEPNGPYLAVEIEERIRGLVAEGGLEDGRDAEQLWYGLAFLGYPWSTDLRQLLLDRTVPEFTDWDIKAQAQVLQHMSELCKELVSDQQKQQLTVAVEELVEEFGLGDEEMHKASLSFTRGVRELGLRVSPECREKLHTMLLNADIRTQVHDIGTARLSHGLLYIVEMGYPITPWEAHRWQSQLLSVWEAEPRSDQQKLQDFGWVLIALLRVRGLVPSEQVKEQLLTVAAQTVKVGVDQRTARVLMQAAEAWGVGLSLETAQRLSKLAAGRGSSTAAAARGSGGGGGKQGAATEGKRVHGKRVVASTVSSR